MPLTPIPFQELCNPAPKKEIVQSEVYDFDFVVRPHIAEGIDNLMREFVRRNILTSCEVERTEDLLDMSGKSRFHFQVQYFKKN